MPAFGILLLAYFKLVGTPCTFEKTFDLNAIPTNFAQKYFAACICRKTDVERERVEPEEEEAASNTRKAQRSRKTG